MSNPSGQFYKGMFLPKPSRKGEFLSEIQAQNKVKSLNEFGKYIAYVKPVKFGSRIKYVVMVSRRAV